jgi:hypothetical protein
MSDPHTVIRADMLDIYICECRKLSLDPQEIGLDALKAA